MNWLFVPLSDEDVLVTGEHVLYRHRRHWAALLPEIAQFFAVLFLQSAFAMRNTTGMSGVLLIGTIVAALILWPMVRDTEWQTWHFVAMALAALWVYQARLSPESVAVLVAAFMAFRLALRVLRWTFYQRTYLTDRRVMEVDGFFGIRVDSMPLTKVTDVMLRRSPLGEVLGYGTFRVESAGQDQALGELRFLVDPERFHDMVVAAPNWQA